MRSPLIRRPRLNSSQETFRCSSASCSIVLTVKAVRSCSSKTPAGRSSKSQLSRASVSQGRGSIVNISSTYGYEGAAGASVYVGSKHAVEGMTKSAALEAAGFGVRVNVVAPDPTDTGMLTRFTGAPENKAPLLVGVPMGRLGLSEELANAIVFIASDEASFITGHILNVDGGHTANFSR